MPARLAARTGEHSPPVPLGKQDRNIDMPKNQGTLEQRFWEKVDRRESDECWPWKGCLHEGYGIIQVRGFSFLAHRISWTIHYGVIPDGLCICHHCDNRLCVNPQHLFLGTWADNNHDMAKKRRSALGERNKHSKLTENQVIEIRRLLALGWGEAHIGSLYGVGHTAIHKIKHRCNWRHIPDEIDRP